MKLTRSLCAAAALLLAACGGDTSARGPADDAKSDSVPPAVAGTAQPADTPPPPDTPVGPPTTPAGEPAPTREDSIAAAREDVSPEWKQRERSMESYASCMAKARDAGEALRARLEKACGGLPDAPR